MIIQNVILFIIDLTWSQHSQSNYNLQIFIFCMFDET